MSKKKRFEKDKEPFIVCIDDLGGMFEFVHWCMTEKEANDIYDEIIGEYPDEEGRNKHLFKMIKTSGQDLDDRDSTGK